MNEDTLIILAISFLGPVIGSLIGVLKKPSERFMYNMLSFAGGVMLAVSFLELIPEGIQNSSVEIAAAGILLGAGTMYVVDRMMPHLHPGLCSQEHGCNLKKTSVYLIIGIFLHNFPEGMAIAVGSVSQTKMGLVIALAIAIHNIPEGICTSAPYFYTTKKRLKAFLISSSTSVPILLGFFIAKALYQQISSSLVGLIIAATAGLMIYITSDEIIPLSCARNTQHTTIFSLILGTVFVVLLGALG